MKNKYEKYRTRDLVNDMNFDKRIEKLYEQKNRLKKPTPGELICKDELESAVRLSYFTELFEGVPLAEQQIEVKDFANPINSIFFAKGREIAEKLVRNNIATMENYADFCKVETGIYRNGR